MAKVSDLAAYYERMLNALPFTEEALRKLREVRFTSAEIHNHFTLARRLVEGEACLPHRRQRSLQDAGPVSNEGLTSQ